MAVIAPVVTGSSLIFDGSGSSGTNGVTVPSDCTLIIIQWSQFDNNADNDMAELSLDGEDFTLVQNVGDGANAAGYGCGYLIDPSTGSQDVAWEWSGGAQGNGGGIGVVFVKGQAATSPIRDSDGDTDSGSVGALTLTTESTDLIIALCSAYQAFTSFNLNGGATLVNDNATGDVGSDLARIGADSSSTSVSGNSDSTIVAISIIGIEESSGEDELLANDVESASEVTTSAVGQKHVILANDVQSTSEVSVPTLAEAAHVLLANDVESASEVSAPAAGQKHALLADDVESASEVSGPALGGKHALLADDVESASEVTAPAAGQKHALLADDVESASEVSAPAVADIPAGVHVLLADDVESASEVTAPAVGQIHAILAEDVESGSEVTNPVVDDGTVSVTGRRGGGGWEMARIYDRYSEDQQDSKKQRRARRKQTEDLEGTDREIARLLHKQLEREARDAEIAKLEAMIQSSYSVNELQKAREYNENVARTYAKAVSKGGFSAIEAFEREMDRAKEEEDFLILAIMAVS
jgi:hypothetical protein